MPGQLFPRAEAQRPLAAKRGLASPARLLALHQSLCSKRRNCDSLGKEMESVQEVLGSAKGQEKGSSFLCLALAVLEDQAGHKLERCTCFCLLSFGINSVLLLGSSFPFQWIPEIFLTQRHPFTCSLISL